MWNYSEVLWSPLQKYLMTETEEKLRTMGVTMDQRRRLMMASKLGLGP